MVRANEFKKAIEARFGIKNFKCYELESNPTVSLALFSKSEKWNDCYIGIMVNQKFHILGLDNFGFINEDVKALYIALKHALPEDDINFSSREHNLLSCEEEAEIMNTLNELFKQKN